MRSSLSKGDPRRSLRAAGAAETECRWGGCTGQLFIQAEGPASAQTLRQKREGLRGWVRPTGTEAGLPAPHGEALMGSQKGAKIAQ